MRRSRNDVNRREQCEQMAASPRSLALRGRAWEGELERARGWGNIQEININADFLVLCFILQEKCQKTEIYIALRNVS